MQETTYSRKLDTSGRIMIPSRLREDMNLVIGKEYNFFTTIEDGHKFICIDCGATVDPIEEAKQLLRKNGITEI